MDKRICGEGGAAAHRAVPVRPDDQQKKKQRSLITRIVLRIVAFIYMVVAVAVHALLTMVVTPPRLILRAVRALDLHGRMQVAGTRALLHEGAKTVHAIGAASRDQAERLRQGLPAFAPAAATATVDATQVPAAKAATVIIEEDAIPAKRRKSPRKTATVEDSAPAQREKRRKSPRKTEAVEDSAPAQRERRRKSRKKAAATETAEAMPAAEAATATAEATPAPTAGVWCASCGHVHPPTTEAAPTTVEATPSAAEASTPAPEAAPTTVEATPSAAEDSTSTADAATATVEATPAETTEAATATAEATPAPTAGVWCASCGHVHLLPAAAADPEVERLADIEIEDDVSDDDEVTTSAYTETSISDDDEVAKKGARTEPAAKQSVRAKIALAVHTIYGKLRMTFVMLMEIFLMPGYAAIGWVHPNRTAKEEVESTHVVRGAKYAAQKTKAAAASLAASVRHMWYRLGVLFMMITHLFTGVLPAAIGWRRGSSEQAVPRTSVGAAPCRAAQDRAVPVVGKAGAAVDREPTEHDVEAVFSAAESLFKLERLLSQIQTPTVPSGGGCASCCGHVHVPPSPSVSAAQVSPAAAPTCSTLHVH